MGKFLQKGVNINTLIEPYRSGNNKQADLFAKYHIKNSPQKPLYASGDNIRSIYNGHILFSDNVIGYRRQEYKGVTLGYLPGKTLLFSRENSATVRVDSTTGEYILNNDKETVNIYMSEGKLYVEVVGNSYTVGPQQLTVQSQGITYTPKLITVVVQSGGGAGGSSKYGSYYTGGGGGSGCCFVCGIDTQNCTNDICSVTLAGQVGRVSYNSSTHGTTLNAGNCSVNVQGSIITVTGGRGGRSGANFNTNTGNASYGGSEVNCTYSGTSLESNNSIIYYEAFKGLAGGNGNGYAGSTANQGTAGDNYENTEVGYPADATISRLSFGGYSGGNVPESYGFDYVLGIPANRVKIGGSGAASLFGNGSASQDKLDYSWSSLIGTPVGAGGGGGCTFTWANADPETETFGTAGGPSAVYIYY